MPETNFFMTDYQKIKAIIQIVSEVTNIPVKIITGSHFTQPVCDARKLAVFIIDEKMPYLTRVRIAKEFQSLTHADIGRCINLFSSLMKNYDDKKDMYEKAKRQTDEGVNCLRRKSNCM